MEKAYYATLVIQRKILNGDKNRHCGHITLRSDELEQFKHHMEKINSCVVHFPKRSSILTKVKSDITIYECDECQSCHYGSKLISEFVFTINVSPQQ